jgi:hypothetical protein
MSLGAYLSSQTFHAFNGDNAVSRWEGDTHVPLCIECGKERDYACHPTRGSIPLENTHLALAHLTYARQELRRAMEVLNVGGPTAGEICMNIGQRIYSLESIEEAVRQARP